MGDSAGTYKLIKGNIVTLPSDKVSQRKVNILLAMKNPVLKLWELPEEFIK
jgi:hypothetical protein